MNRFLFSLLLIGPLTISAQYTPEETTVEPHILRLHILSPGVEYELGLGRYTSINAFAGLTSALWYTQNEGLMYFLNPTINLQYRYYYNMRRRALKDKRTDYNSADFLAVHLEGTGNTLLSNSDMSFQGNYAAGLVWGLQRTFQNGISLGGYIGPGVGIQNSGDLQFQLLTGLRIGYTFRSRADRQEAKLRRMERQGTW